MVYLQDLRQSQVWSLKLEPPKNLGNPNIQSSLLFLVQFGGVRGGDSSGIEEFDTDEADRSLNEKSSAQKKYEQQRFRVQPGPIENYSLGRGSLAQKVLKGPRKRSQMFLKETLQNKKTNFILALWTSMCLILICNKSYFAIFYLKLFT